MIEALKLQIVREQGLSEEYGWDDFDRLEVRRPVLDGLFVLVNRYVRHDEHCHERVCTCGLNAAIDRLTTP